MHKHFDSVGHQSERSSVDLIKNYDILNPGDYTHHQSDIRDSKGLLSLKLSKLKLSQLP